MKYIRIILSLFIMVPALSGCLRNEQFDPCDYDPCERKAPDSEIQQVQAYLNANNIVATQHCSGLFYSIDNQGTGATPQVCSNITVLYEGRLTDGTVFDQSAQNVTFNLSQVIDGWKNGLPQIQAGGRINLYIPPTLGYGGAAAGSIPPNSILIFRVDLVAVQ